MNWDIAAIKEDTLLHEDDKIYFCGLQGVVDSMDPEAYYVKHFMEDGNSGDEVYELARSISDKVSGDSYCPEMPLKDLPKFLCALYSKILADGLEAFIDKFYTFFDVAETIALRAWGDDNKALLAVGAVETTSVSGRGVYMPEFESTIEVASALEICSRRKRRRGV